VVAYELLTGAKPYKLKRGSAAELEEAIATADAPKASDTATESSTRKALRGDLDAILNKALKKAAEERYSTIDALADDVRRHLDGEPVAAAPDSLTYRARKFVARHKAASAVLALLLAGVVGGAYAQVAVMIALAVGIGVALWQRNRAENAAAQARAQAAVAEKERARATQVKDFLLRLLVESDTDSGSTAQTTVAQLLRRASADIDTALSLDGDALLQLKTALGSALTSLGEPAEAVKLLEPAVLALSDAEKDSPLGQDACFRYGEALHVSMKTEAAIAILRELARRAERRESLVVGAKTNQQLASALINAGQMEHALAAIRTAVANAQQLDADKYAVLRAQVFAAEVNALRSTGQPGQLTAARRALAAAQHSDKIGRNLRLTARVMLAEAEVTEGSISDGIAAYHSVSEPFIEAYGPDHQLTAAFRSWFGAALLIWGDPARATDHFDTVLNWSRRIHGEGAMIEAHQHWYLARTDAMLGNPTSARNRLRHATAILARLPPNPAMTALVRDQHVLIALEQGELPPQDAVPDDYWKTSPANDASRAQWFVRRLGVEQIGGRRVASEDVREAVEVTRTMARRAQRWSESALLARIALRANLHEEARQILVPLLAELEPMQAPDSPLLKTVRALLQEAQMTSGAASATPSA
jgi:tetratricopeptide (TPR) repeat protein